MITLSLHTTCGQSLLVFQSQNFVCLSIVPVYKWRLQEEEKFEGKKKVKIFTSMQSFLYMQNFLQLLYAFRIIEKEIDFRSILDASC